MDEWQVFYVAMLGSVAFVTLMFGGLVLAQSPPRAANRYLAAFLFLIAANQAVETAVGLLVANGHGLPHDPVLNLKELAYVFAAADPFVLFCFASVFPERNRLSHPAALAVVGSGSASLMFLAPWTYANRGEGLGFFALDAFTAAVYLVVFGRFALLAARERLGSVEKLLLFGSAVAAIPVIVRATYSLGRVVALSTFIPNYAVWGVTSLLLVGALAMDGRSRVATRSFTWASVVGCSVAVVAFLPVFVAPLPTFGAIVGPFHDFVGINAPLRWLLFSLLVSIAVFRHDMLGMSLGSRRRAARAAVVVALFVVAVALVSGIRLYLGRGAFRLEPTDAALIVLVLVLSGSVRAWVVRLGDRLYGIPHVDDRGSAVALYEDAVAQARREGRLVPLDDDLTRLRRELKIDAATADLVERASLGNPHSGVEVGATLEDRYEVNRFLGRGSSGRVFRAKDRLLDRPVCLKDVVETVGASGDRLLDEARAAVRVRHPNVLAVFDVIPRTGRVIIVSELLSGTLQEKVEQTGPMPFGTAARVYDGVLAGLEAIHHAQVLHRDLKPGNVFVAEDGTAKIGDFGISLLDVGATLAAGAVVPGGTAGYLAPEVLHGQAPTPAADLYAVGRMIERTVDDDAKKVLAPLIERATARDPNARFESAAAMRAALRQVVADVHVAGA